MRTKLFALVVGVVFTPVAFAMPSYNVFDITPTGYSSAAAYDINSSGDVVGVASGTPGTHFFFYDHSAGTSTAFGVGVIDPRDPLLGAGFRQVAINDSGVIAGTAKFVSGSTERRGFVYTGSVATSLGTLAGDTATVNRPESDGLDINATALVTGTGTSGVSTIGAGGDNLDVYKNSGAPLSDLDGDTSITTRGDYGLAINDAGLIVGRNQDVKATLFGIGGAETVLLAGTSEAGDSSLAVDLNEVGQIAIENSTDSDSYVYNTTTTTLTTIDQIGAGNRMFVKGINEDGDAVGWGDKGGGDLAGLGFVFDISADTSYALQDVSDLTTSDSSGFSDWLRLNTAWAINDDGWIVGEGERRFGTSSPSSRAYLLTPVPEPASAALLLFGLGMLTRRRG